MRMEIHPFPLATLTAAWDALKGRFTVDENGCWIANHASPNGYAYLKFEGEPRTGHSVAYEKMTGERYRKEDKLELGHKCHIRRCWNPLHVEPMTRQKNNSTRVHVKQYHPLREMITHCPQGHPYDEENTYYYRGARYCRECGRIKWRKSHPPGWQKRK